MELERIATPIGDVLAATRGDVLCALEFADDDDRIRRHLERRFGAAPPIRDGSDGDVARRLAAYFAGARDAFEGLALEPRGTAFQESVWRELRNLGFGETTSYGALAARLGNPRGMRAVGLANGANPIAIVIPCHRVIGADGSLTGYAGGLRRKEWLLRHEGALLA